METTQFYVFFRKCDNLPNLTANFQGYKQLVKILLCKILDIYIPVIILPSLKVIRCTVTEKNCAQTVLLKSMLYAFTMATVDTTTFFSA